MGRPCPRGPSRPETAVRALVFAVGERVLVVVVIGTAVVVFEAVVVFGLSTILFGSTAFMPRSIAVEIGIAALLLLGAADMVSVYVRQSLIQLHTPDAMRGRVSSLSQLTISASNELGEAESGFLAALVGPVAAVIGGGVGAIVITLIWARLFPELRLARTFDPPDLREAHISQEKVQ